jgi:hypothetical protein
VNRRTRTREVRLASTLLAAAAAAAAAAVAAAGCGRDAPDAPPLTASAAASSAEPSARPVDHLAADELVEGHDTAFGVPLPRGVLVEHRYVDTVQASGPMPVRALVKYFQARLHGGSLREGDVVATFEHVNQPGAPDAELQIHIEATLGKTRIDLTSFHHQEAVKLPDEAARWRAVGLTPNGKVLDPAHLE